MPAGLSPKEEREAQARIARAQAMARTASLSGFDAAQMAAARPPESAAADSAAEQEMIQQQTLAAQIAQAAKLQAQQALAQQEQELLAAEAAGAAIGVAGAQEESVIAQQAFKAAKKKIEFMKQQISDRLENLAESTGESFVLAGMIYIVLAIWVVIRVLRTILIKSESGFMGLAGALVPPYTLGQMLLAAVVVIFGLILICTIIGLAVIMIMIAVDSACTILRFIPDPLEDLVNRAFGIPKIPCP
jgi:hypothetical protein